MEHDAIIIELYRRKDVKIQELTTVCLCFNCEKKTKQSQKKRKEKTNG